MDNQEQNSVTILDIPQIKKSLDLVHSTLEKANKGGILGLDDAFLVKISCNNLVKTVDTLDQYQKLFIEMSKKREEDNLNAIEKVQTS
jgi:hypothetical protein